MSTNREEAVKLKNEGNALFAAGNFKDAIPLYRKAQVVDPTYFAPYYNCGICCLNIGAFDDAKIGRASCRERV